MGKYINNYKYLLYICAFFIGENFIIRTKESLFTIIYSLPYNVIHFAMMLAYIILLLTYYIHSILDFIILEDEIKIRIKAKYMCYISKKVFISFIMSAIVLLSYCLILKIELKYMLLLMLSHLISFFIFIISTIILKKKNYQHIMLVNIILLLIFRLILSQIAF